MTIIKGNLVQLSDGREFKAEELDGSCVLGMDKDGESVEYMTTDLMPFRFVLADGSIVRRD